MYSVAVQPQHPYQENSEQEKPRNCSSRNHV